MNSDMNPVQIHLDLIRSESMFLKNKEKRNIRNNNYQNNSKSKRLYSKKKKKKGMLETFPKQRNKKTLKDHLPHPFRSPRSRSLQNKEERNIRNIPKTKKQKKNKK